MLKGKNVVKLEDNQFSWIKPKYFKRLDETNFVSPDCEVFTEDKIEEKLKETFTYKNPEIEDAKEETRDQYTLKECTEFEFNSVVMDTIKELESELAVAKTRLEKSRRMFGVV